MHAIDLAELASTFVRLASPLTSLKLPPRRPAALEYWLAVRYRQENWLHDLAQHRDAIQRPGASRRIRLWMDILPVVQEVFLSEPLTRVVAYMASLWESRGIDDELAPLAVSSLASHIEARNRCLHLIVFGQGLAVENAVKINRLRRNLESYTDHLLSLLPPLENPGLFAFEVESMLREQSNSNSADCSGNWLTLQSLAYSEQLWQTLHHEMDWRSASARLNYQVSQHTLGLLPSTCFDSCGALHSAPSLQILQPSLEGHIGPHTKHPLFELKKEPSSNQHRINLLPSSRRYRND